MEKDRNEPVLKVFSSMEELDFPKLMEVYRESNTDNVPEFFPDCTDMEEGRKMVEEEFRKYLESDFFKGEGNRYYALVSGDVWLSALRLFPVSGKPGEYYLEALETRPDRRRRGYGRELFRQLFLELKKEGSFVITDSVSKRNEASLHLHESCGFRIFQEDSVCVLNGYENPRAYGLRYCSDQEA